MTSSESKLVLKLISVCHLEVLGIHMMIKLFLSFNLGNKRASEKPLISFELRLEISCEQAYGEKYPSCRVTWNTG